MFTRVTTDRHCQSKAKWARTRTLVTKRERALFCTAQKGFRHCPAGRSCSLCSSRLRTCRMETQRLRLPPGQPSSLSYGTMDTAADIEQLHLDESKEPYNDESKLGLLDHAFPQPSEPWHTPRRTLSACVVLFFLVVVSWFAFQAIYSDEYSEAAWLDMSWLSSKNFALGSDTAAASSALNQFEADASVLEDPEDGQNPQLIEDDDIALVSRRPTDLARYLWHTDVAWDTRSDGRLIFVGDVHGMVSSLRYATFTPAAHARAGNWLSGSSTILRVTGLSSLAIS